MRSLPRPGHSPSRHGKSPSNRRDSPSRSDSPLTTTSGVSGTGEPNAPAPGTDAAHRFRPDIEGLRAVAILAVLLYHAGLPVTGGYVGVDVFFVLSGFLMTRLILDEIERTGSLSISRFYARRARRLLPAVAVVLAAVALLSWLLFSPVDRDSVAVDLVASALYAINWWLSGQAVDYFASGLQASPVQHFWSLAVEEQFYVVWPVLLLGAVWLVRRFTGTGSPRRTLLAVVAGVGTASLAYSVFGTLHAADTAYFDTVGRGWEFAVGGAVALVGVPRLASKAATVLAWAGLAAIGWSAVTFDEATLFPAPWALLPALGTAAVIAAGTALPSARPQQLLGTPVMRHLGRISYSWYLWHWPALVFAASAVGELSAAEGLAAVAGAYVLATATYHLVEQPFRRSPVFQRPRRALTLGAACTTIAVIPGLVLSLTIPSLPTKAPGEATGAPALGQGDAVQRSVDAVRPEPRLARQDWPRNYNDGCHADRPETTSPACVYGDPESDRTVVLFGDSHAMQYFPALERLAKDRGWRLVSLTKSGCPPPQVGLHNDALRRYYSECDTWRADMLDRIKKEQPDLVLTGGRDTYTVVDGERRLDAAGSAEALRDGYADTLTELRGTGARVVTIKDNPHPDKDVPSCVSRAPQQLAECAIPQDTAFAYPHVADHAANRVDGARLLDPTPAFCRDGTCPAVIGDVVVYGVTTHLTATYARTLAPWLDEQLASLNALS
ncbi:acyltransferase family protein [Prauserella alba]|uniref:SGNH hydrolase domain-containing protein n=1 Tax=Prauserella alba TaxID=176898 RepID=A0ABN1VLN9_9PSEU|nr:acyltransferase family protein [Prauserella alba]MCP2180903.1 Peptidoglycan/LPS O-acetylase OafA/YrhL, contains acyltransferase and SGNH-hydrolase domains [Prauserella alba]